VLNNRISAAAIADVRQRRTRPEHGLRQDLSQQLHGSETNLVRKLRQGAASKGVVKDAQMMRANADHLRLREAALGTWPDDPAVAADLDQRLLFLARRVGRT
ncbi:hypothetical protein, partial [Streptomyces brasiliscabiei]|uniref:hypothetical protein n=1 Tax=Streptomyces brasiliscabiei TaxID=2736302 RepID=UPI001C11047C